VAENKSPEALLQDALTAAQDRNKQLETDLGTERAARGKAEQSLLDANKLAEQRSTDLGTEKAAHAKTTQALADANKLVDQLNDQLAEPTSGPKVHTAKLGSDTYRFVVPQFYLEGFGKVKAEEVKANSDVLKALVKAGSKVIEQVAAK
jgi:hypothetical protein